VVVPTVVWLFRRVSWWFRPISLFFVVVSSSLDATLVRVVVGHSKGGGLRHHVLLVVVWILVVEVLVMVFDFEWMSDLFLYFDVA
jgi:hypothetical protein